MKKEIIKKVLLIIFMVMSLSIFVYGEDLKCGVPYVQLGFPTVSANVSDSYIFSICDNGTFQYEIGSSCSSGEYITGVWDNGTLNCSSPPGSSGASKWLDNGTFISPNATFATQVFSEYFFSTDWSNVTVNTSQIVGYSAGGNSTWNETKANNNYIWQSWTNLTYDIELNSTGNWTKDKPDYFSSANINSTFQLNITNQSCSGTEKFTGYNNGTFTCGADAGGSGASKWLDNGTFISPNSSFATQVFSEYFFSTDWSNVTINTSQIVGYSAGGNATFNQTLTNGIYVWQSWTNLTYDIELNSTGNWTKDKPNYINITNTSWIETNQAYDGNVSSICGDDDVLLGQDTTTCVDLNQTILDLTRTIIYNATSIATVEGTLDDGNLTSIQIADDGDSYNVSEVAGANPLLIDINFTGVIDFNSIVFNVRHDDASGHIINVCLWDYDDAAWDCQHGTIVDTNVQFVFEIKNVLDPASHILGGLVQLRLDQIENGIPSHDLFIDYLVLQDGFSTLQGQETDPFAFHKSGDVIMDGDANFGNFNVTNVSNINITSCIYFGSGGKICSGT